MLTPEELRDISEFVEPGANIAFARKYTPEQRWRMANNLRAMADAEPVAWQYKKEGGGLFVSDHCPEDTQVWNDIEWYKPLYTTQQSKDQSC